MRLSQRIDSSVDVWTMCTGYVIHIDGQCVLEKALARRAIDGAEKVLIRPARSSSVLEIVLVHLVGPNFK